MIRYLKSKGLSNKQIAYELGINRKTVAKWLDVNILPKYSRRKTECKLDPYKTHILTRIDEGCVNANILLDEIIGMGYQGKSTILRDFIRPHRALVSTKASIRYETPPGKQAQVDWGEFVLSRTDGSFTDHPWGQGNNRLSYPINTFKCRLLA